MELLRAAAHRFTLATLIKTTYSNLNKNDERLTYESYMKPLVCMWYQLTL